MTIQLFDSMLDKKVPLETLEPGHVKLYVCGPTVYDMSHLGHARCYVAWDVVVRHLRARGFRVTHVRNFTDVDDKIIRRAHERGEEPMALAAHYVDEFNRDMADLQNIAPDLTPRVTEHLPEIVAMIERLIETKNAYASGGDVYFSVRSFPGYGKLSGRNLDDLKSGARVEVGELKQDPLDFALWKAAKPGEISWPSPWGDGRPGWHIECSAMSCKYLGETFDIHAGGKDLVFPHHENEIAQSEAASGKTFARYWMHNGFVTVDDEKMSKSLGNFSTIRELTAQVDPQGVRLFLLSTHYRAPINLSDVAIMDAERRVQYIYETLQRVDSRLGQPKDDDLEGPAWEASRVDRMLADFNEAMDDDFNSAEAIGRMSAYLGWMNELCDRFPAGAPKAEVRRTLARLRANWAKVAAVLGVGHEDPTSFLERLRTRQAARHGIDAAEVEALIVARKQARADKDFAAADELRTKATRMGVEIMDTPAGTTWRVVAGS